MDCRVIATDLDQTLLGPGGTFTDRAAAALTAARAAGIAVVAVTARPYRAFEAWTRLAAHLDVAICAGGTLVYTPSPGAVTVRRTLDPGAVLETAARLHEADPRLRFAAETGHAVHAGADYDRRDTVFDRRIAHATFADAVAAADPLVQVYVSTPGSVADLHHLATELDLPGVRVWHAGSRDKISLLPVGVSKAEALAEWCLAQGIGAESVVAFGDAHADIPMLQWAGRSYAVANATREAAAAASHSCGPSTEDGVAVVINALVCEADAARAAITSSRSERR